MVLCCGLTSAFRYVDSEIPWKGLPCRPKSVTALICHSCVYWLDSFYLKFSSKCLLVMSGDSQVVHEHFHKVSIIFLIVGLLSLKDAPLKTVIAAELPVKFMPIPLRGGSLLQP